MCGVALLRICSDLKEAHMMQGWVTLFADGLQSAR